MQLLSCSLTMTVRTSANTPFLAVKSPRELLQPSSVSSARNRVPGRRRLRRRSLGGGGTHTGPAFSDFLHGALPAASGRTMRFTGTTVLRVENGKIAEEIGLDDGVTALTQLGLMRAAR